MKLNNDTTEAQNLQGPMQDPKDRATPNKVTYQRLGDSNDKVRCVRA